MFHQFLGLQITNSGNITSVNGLKTHVWHSVVPRLCYSEIMLEKSLSQFALGRLDNTGNIISGLNSG
jgi:hypothetical protein